MSKNNDYPCIRAWGQQMGSMSYYIDAQIEKARKDKAPEDAIYQRHEGSQPVPGVWARLSEVTSPETQWNWIRQHRDLVEKFAPDWLKDRE
jgi:hypothetical protein